MNVTIACLLLAFFGVNFDPTNPNAGIESTAVPINAKIIEVVQPDGMRRTFRATDNPQVYQSDVPWIGICTSPSTFVVYADPEFTDGQRRTALTFKDGVLSEIFLDGNSYPIAKRPDPPPADESALKALWPTYGTATEERGKNDIWRDGRLRLGQHGSPNTAATLFVEIALIGLGIAFLRKWYFFIPGFALYGAMAFLLLKTGSRSGVIAIAGGTAIIAFFALLRRFSWWKLAVIIILLAGGVAGAVKANLAERITRNFLGQSEEKSRFPIWRETPKMMADSPTGWGLGDSDAGYAYVYWYQPLDRYHVVRTMINGHLTWLVGGGWTFRFAYCFLWVFAAMMALALAWKFGEATPLALVFTLFTTMTFNHVGETWWVWPLPGLLLLSPLVCAKIRRDLRTRRTIIIAALAASVTLLACVATFCVGRSETMRTMKGGFLAPPISHVSGKTVIGKGEPRAYIVEDYTVLGGAMFLGKEIREYYLNNPEAPALGFVRNIDDLPKAAPRIVLAGKSAEEYIRRFMANDRGLPRTDNLLLLSPSVSPLNIPREFVDRAQPVVLAGSLALRMTMKMENLPDWVIVVPGRRLYLPGYIDFILQ